MDSGVRSVHADPARALGKRGPISPPPSADDLSQLEALAFYTDDATNFQWITL